MTYTKKMISLVIPLYNEEATIKQLYVQIISVIKMHIPYAIEFVFIDDGSTDTTWHLVQSLAQSDIRVRGIQLSRNFGHQIALTAGYDYACGDAIITMDADLQDPPLIIPQLIAQWEKGFSVVYAQRIGRTDSWFKKQSASWYYWFLSQVTAITMPRNVGDFRLLDKKVVQILRACPEQYRYVRGLVAWTGFPAAYVPFRRPNRFAGCSGYTWKKMIRLGWDGLTSFSFFPLQIAGYVGSIVCFSGMCVLSYLSITTLLFRSRYDYMFWLICLLYTIAGIQLLCLWFIGEYLGRMHTEQKKRPLYVIASELGNDKNK